ncbi:MAG TPA: VIT domain-containing protein [Longimicrobium sp.]|nr:VIT domain-containing protein [Longimicrobium sp.]
MNTRRITRILLPLAALAVLPALAGARRPSAAAHPPAAQADTAPPAPFALSDPDGQDLVLERLDVRTAVHGMLALTEVEMRFRNPRQRRMEGRFSAVLPEGATVSRFAKELDGHLVEGEVVERQRAHRVYDEILHEMRDPAMLDQEAGNRFSAKVFPIDPGATVRLVLGYSQVLRQTGGERSYTLPLRGMPRVGVFTFHGSFRALPGESRREATFVQTAGPGRVREAGQAWTIDRSDESFVPREDLQVAWRADAAAPAARILSAGGFYVAAFRPAVPPVIRAAGPGSWVFYLDTSASGADGAEHRVRAIERLLAALPAGDAVEVRAFDHRVQRLASGSAAQVARQVGALLRARRYLGGTDLGAVLRDAAAAARAHPAAAIVVQTDGVGTLGTVDPALLRAAADSIPARATVHALVLGARQDEATLRTITGGRGRIVTIPFTDSLEVRAAAAARRLALPPGATFTAADPGAEWVYATGADDVQPGDEVLVMARLKPGARPSPRLAGRGGVLPAGAAEPLEAGSFGPLLEREAYRAYLRDLADRASRTTDDSTRAALADEEVRISVEHRVLSPRTTLLVLESERDYARFGLDRRALAGILTVGENGITLAGRDTAALRVSQAAVAKADSAAGQASTAPGAAADSTRVLARRALNLQSVVASGAGVQARDRDGEDEAGDADEADDEEDGASSDAPPPPPAAVIPPPPPPPAEMEPPAPVLATPRPTRPAEPRTESRVEPRVAGVSAGNRPGGASPASPPAALKAPAWTRPSAPTRGRVDSLRAELAATPRDREVRNQLADALWARREWAALRELALEWQPYDPENPHVYEALGEADVNLGRRDEAERALGSLVEVADGKPELLQRAGLLLLRVNAARLAETPLRRALEQRPDRVNGYRHLALMLWQDGREQEAARVLEDATRRAFPGWYGDAQRVVHEELGYVLRAWIAKEPARRAQVRGEAAEFGVDLDRRDALRVTLAWDADGNDVDLHVVDPAGEECYYAHDRTALGLHLYGDITQGFGPEVIRTDRVVSGTYHVGVTYFSAGAMGVSRGVVVVMRPGATADRPAVQILPFRLVEGNASEVRHLLSIEVPPR